MGAKKVTAVRLGWGGTQQSETFASRRGTTRRLLYWPVPRRRLIELGRHQDVRLHREPNGAPRVRSASAGNDSAAWR